LKRKSEAVKRKLDVVGVSGCPCFLAMVTLACSSISINFGRRKKREGAVGITSGQVTAGTSLEE
jgi:hypothetical protein